MDLKNERDKTDKKEFNKKFNAQRFLTKNIAKEKDKNQNNKLMTINNNNNLIKFINVTKDKNKCDNEIINQDSNIRIIKEMKTIEFKNKIKLKLEPDKEIEEININKINHESNNNIINKEKNSELIKNIPDNINDKKETIPINISINNKENNHSEKFITSSKKEKENLELNNNDNNNFNNHKYLYVNSSKGKNNIIKIYQFKEKNNDNIINNPNNIIQKTENINIKKSKINTDNELYKIKNDYNINKEDKNIMNNIFVNSLDERIEKIRETLNSINVMDILADQAGFQSYKNDELKNDDFYNKAKMLNKEFYDNLDVKFNEIENILNDLETNE